ncbi:hypothetical protein ABH920_001689 [Catenulispora sp. EB89]|uniref:hypothetical protein n=1 Tax=Catenulispora sp. EB89 TaxID=3156257 RepID=UPI003516630C
MTVFGIDLGRSRACIAWLPAGAGAPGSAAIPPAVRFAGPDEVLVGEPALAAPPGTSGPFIASVYDLLARSADVLDADVQAFERTHSPEWVAARVLSELADRARAATGGTVRDVVLATPVDLGVAPIAAQRRAADEAGLAVRGTVLAPIAVCMHYEAIGEGLAQNLVVCIVDAAGPQICALRVREYLVDVVRVPHIADTSTEGWIDAVRTAGATVGGAVLDDLDAVLLAGADATPDLAAQLHEALGIPVRCDEPGAAVAAGAARSADFGFLRVNTSGTPSSNPAPRPLPFVTTPEREDPEPARQQPVSTPEEQIRPRTQPPYTPPTPPSPPPQTPSGPFTAPPTAPPTGHVPPTRPAPSAGPDASYPQPVAALTAERREEHALLTWIWPPDCVISVVRWQIGRGGDARRGETECTRRVYEHEGGFQLRIGASESLFTVEALVPGSSPEPAPPSSVGLAALPPAIRYVPAVQGRGSRRTGQVTLTSDTDCTFPAIDVVLARGHYLPRGAHEGEVVHRIAGAHLSPRMPLTVQFPLAGHRGPFWLVCFTADPAEASVELLPESLHRLKVG